MAAMTKEQILDSISSMTVLEVSELVKAMEEKFGVTAAAPMAMAAGPAAAAAPAAEEQTEFTVVLKSYDDAKKIPVIKEVRGITGLGLKEAKDLVEAGNKTLKENVSKEEAAKIKQQLDGGKINPRDLKRRLARELVTLYHDDNSARTAEQEFDRIFIKKEAPDDVPVVKLSAPDGSSLPILRLLTESGLVTSNSEARRLVEQGGVSVDGQQVTSYKAMIPIGRGILLQVGKRKFARIRLQ